MWQACLDIWFGVWNEIISKWEFVAFLRDENLKLFYAEKHFGKCVTLISLEIETQNTC